MKGESTHLFEVTMSYRSNAEAVWDVNELRSQLRRMVSVRSIFYWLFPRVWVVQTATVAVLPTLCALILRLLLESLFEGVDLSLVGLAFIGLLLELRGFVE